jgi:subfamily B ATP-binding cassette protein MsbA
MTLESFMAIGFALYMSYEPIKKLGAVHTQFQQGTAALDRLEEVLHAEGELTDLADAKVPAPFVGEVSFEQVGFCYGEESILSDINVHVRPGECLALIGPSGAGKSTFVKLIPRFYDVTEGSIKVGGQDVRSWPKQDLREKIAVVSQSPVLFSGTIRENILLGRPGATDAEVEEAARRANAHDFILEQEQGYDTEVAEKGTKVSGGQGQRIAIARAFLKDAPILILDEATSALDHESEAKIQEALGKLIQNRTTLIIAHRLSTTKIADRVLEFDRGRIVAERAEA